MKKTSEKESELNFIGQTTSVEGNIKSEGDLHINGSVKGIIKCSGSISLGENGMIEGDIYAENVIIDGIVRGKLIIKNKITLESKSQLYGEMSCGRLIIEEGSIFAGNAVMGDQQSRKNEKIKK